MEAAIPNASSIKINFGERQPTPTPINVSMTIDFFSSEVFSPSLSMNTSEVNYPKNIKESICQAHVLPSNLMFQGM